MAENLYQDLKDALQTFRDFLNPERVGLITEVYKALRGSIRQVEELLTKLIDLLGQVKTQIQNIDVNIPGLSEMSGFVQSTRAFLQTTRKLLPEQAESIDAVLTATDVIGSLPSLDQVKTEVINLIDEIVGILTGIKNA